MTAILASRKLIVIIVALAWLLRLTAAVRLSIQVDEASSVLAARMVASRGVPVLPSGVLYLQGATLSYLLAPLVWLGFGDANGLTILRLVSGLAGTIAVYAIYRATSSLTGSCGAGVLAALMLAIDPLSVEWSGHVRMYAMLQALVVMLIWCAVAILRRGIGTRRLAALVALAWAAVFTHPAAMVPLAVVVGVLIVIRGDQWIRAGLPAPIAALLVGIAPLVYLALNRLAGLRDQTTVGTTSFSFVGAQLIQPAGILRPDIGKWAALLEGGPGGRWIPVLLICISGYLLLCVLIGSDRIIFPASVVLLLCAYWLPVITIVSVTDALQPRYLVFIQPLGFVLLATALDVAARTYRTGRGNHGRWHLSAVLAPIMLTVLLLLGAVQGLHRQYDHPVIGPDYLSAFAFVRRHHRPGEPIIVSLPPLAELGLDRSDDLLFLAGPERGVRVERYVLDGGPHGAVDYWLGVPAISSTGQLCQVLTANPDAWLVVDETRLWSNTAYTGVMSDVILGMTYGIYRAPDGALVRRTAPAYSQIPSARQICVQAVSRDEPKSLGSRASFAP